MEEGDEWLAVDKLEHLLACFLITLFVAAACSRSRSPIIRRRSAALGSLVSLAAGAAKEAGDEIGFWRSAGGSVKDAVADLVGIVLAVFSLSLYRRFFPSSHRKPDVDRIVSMA